MRALFDVNALLAIFDIDHTFHVTARAWWRANADAGWATCPITQNGFVRIISQRSYPGYWSPVEAIETLRSGAEQAEHAFWPDDVSIVDPSVVDRERILSHKNITDIYLLALAMKHGGRLVTFDRAIPLAAVRGAAPDNLVVL